MPIKARPELGRTTGEKRKSKLRPWPGSSTPFYPFGNSAADALSLFSRLGLACIAFFSLLTFQPHRHRAVRNNVSVLPLDSSPFCSSVSSADHSIIRPLRELVPQPQHSETNLPMSAGRRDELGDKTNRKDMAKIVVNYRKQLSAFFFAHLFTLTLTLCTTPHRIN